MSDIDIEDTLELDDDGRFTLPQYYQTGDVVIRTPTSTEVIRDRATTFYASENDLPENVVSLKRFGEDPVFYRVTDGESEDGDSA